MKTFDSLFLGAPAKSCGCGSGLPRRPLVDAHGVFCAFGCDQCEPKEARRHMREKDWRMNGMNPERKRGDEPNESATAELPSVTFDNSETGEELTVEEPMLWVPTPETTEDRIVEMLISWSGEVTFRADNLTLRLTPGQARRVAHSLLYYADDLADPDNWKVRAKPRPPRRAEPNAAPPTPGSGESKQSPFRLPIEVPKIDW